MIYKFKSKAAGDVIMLGPNGDQMLRLIGRDPAPRGIIEKAAMPAAIAALEAAVAAEDARAVAAASAAVQRPGTDKAADDAPRAIGLRQRVWPMVEMMRRAEQAREDVVWGV